MSGIYVGEISLDTFKSVCEKYRLEVEKSSDDAMGLYCAVLNVTEDVFMLITYSEEADDRKYVSLFASNRKTGVTQQITRTPAYYNNVISAIRSANRIYDDTKARGLAVVPRNARKPTDEDNGNGPQAGENNGKGTGNQGLADEAGRGTEAQ
jgi:hypothetical protein